ncbi:AT-hook motif nuclear-localized protein 5 [Raphanus sativus]|nr:AT-hook motif nuclear-localized protein 5 [Raphanus sativus]
MNLSAARIASGLHVPPGMKPMSNPNVHHHLAHNPEPRFSRAENIYSDFDQIIHMRMTLSATVQPPSLPLPPPQMKTSMVKKKLGRPRKSYPFFFMAFFYAFFFC